MVKTRKILFIFICALCFFMYGCGNKENKNVETTGAIEETNDIREIVGTVKDATMNSITITDNDGNEYCFRTEDVEINAGEDGVLIGSSASITYRGILDNNLDSIQQNIEIISINIVNTGLESNNSDEDNLNDNSQKVDIADTNNNSANTDTKTDTITERANNILKEMSIEEKVGQMFIARCPESNAASKVSEYKIGGYILFGRDFSGKTKSDVISNIKSYQNEAEIPLFIGVDEEGGTVNRVSTNSNFRAVPFWSPQDLYAEGGFDLIRSDAKEKCELLNSLGINLNFAPVCDVSQNKNDFIYSRSFGKDAELTSTYVTEVVKTMVQESTGSVLKHFPGYGNNSDTHTGVAYDNREYSTFENSDFLPFKAGIEAGASMVLVSHNVVSCMDKEMPASLSTNVHSILREKLGFNGVIITDDLVMEGVRSFASDKEIAVQAVKAGNDMLCCTDFEVQIPAVIEAVKNGDISEQRINESVLRILKLKISLGIIK